jgi:VanZ family protein
MTPQEIFYYTVSACSWIFIIMMVVIFYRINRCISQWQRTVGRIESVIDSIPKTIGGIIRATIISIIKKIGGEKNERRKT